MSNGIRMGKAKNKPRRQTDACFCGGHPGQCWAVTREPQAQQSAHWRRPGSHPPWRSSAQGVQLRNSLTPAHGLRIALGPMFLSRSICAPALRRAAFSTALSSLSPVTEHDIAHFAKFLQPSSIISTLSPRPSPPDELEPYNNDWMGKYLGRSTTVLKPKTTHEVSEILKWCNQRRIGVVPQGGNTGLVGGSVPLNNEIILSLSNLNILHPR